MVPGLLETGQKSDPDTVRTHCCDMELPDANLCVAAGLLETDAEASKEQALRSRFHSISTANEKT